jgi:uncharacterized membrane protein YecN with MAPEG domain
MPSISALYGGLYALLLIALALPISLRRRKLGIGINDGGDSMLARAVRVHANAVEWGLPILLLLLLAELNRASPLLLHVGGALFLLGRIAHAIGLSGRSGPSPGRVGGIGTTWVVLIVLAVWDVWAYVRLLLV